MNKSHLLNPDLGLQQLRPSSGRPFFESPIPDPALFFFFYFLIFLFYNEKIAANKRQSLSGCWCPGDSFGKGVYSSPKASPKRRGGKMVPLAFAALPCSPELLGWSWCCRHRWTKQPPATSLRSKAALLPISSKNPEVLFMSCVLVYFEQVP